MPVVEENDARRITFVVSDEPCKMKSCDVKPNQAEEQAGKATDDNKDGEHHVHVATASELVGAEVSSRVSSRMSSKMHGRTCTLCTVGSSVLGARKRGNSLVTSVLSKLDDHDAVIAKENSKMPTPKRNRRIARRKRRAVE